MLTVPPALARGLLSWHESILGRTTFSILAKSREANPGADGLQQLLLWAREEIPFWKDRIPATGNLSAVGVLTRTQIRESAPALLWPRYPGKILQHRSGGTTDDNLTFFWGRERQSWDRAMRLRGILRFGVQTGEPVLHLWPRYPAKSTLDRMKVFLRDVRDRLVNDVVFDLRPFSPESLTHALQFLESYRPVLIISYPSWLVALARHLRQLHHPPRFPRLRRILCAGEVLFDFQRRLIAETFSAPVFQEYGSQDSGVLAHEDEQRRLLLHSEMAVLEILRDGRPAPPGELGEVVITQLHNPVMPFIRYATGDAMRQPFTSTNEQCPLPEGRTSDQLVAVDGTLRSMRPVIEALAILPGMDDFTLHQSEVGQVQVLYVESPGRPPPQADGDDILREHLGQNANVSWTRGSGFVPLTSGKKRFICSPVAMRLLAHDRSAGLHLARSWPQRLLGVVE